MLDLEDLQRAGDSATGRAWLTTPVRRTLFAVARPYLARLLQALNDLDLVTVRRYEFAEMTQRLDGLAQHADGLAQQLDGLGQKFDGLSRQLDGLGQRLDGLSHRLDGSVQRLDALADLIPPPPEPPIETPPPPVPEPARLAEQDLKLIDALRKDQIAINHRLASIEDEAETREPSDRALVLEVKEAHARLEAAQRERHALELRLAVLEAAANHRGPVTPR